MKSFGSVGQLFTPSVANESLKVDAAAEISLG